MASFQASPIASPFGNILYDPMSVDQAVRNNQKNDLMMDASRQEMRRVADADNTERMARGAEYILSLPTEQRPAAYKAQLAWGRSQGRAYPNAPPEYPGDSAMEMIRRAGIPAVEQYKQGIGQQSRDAAMPPRPGGPATAGGGGAPALAPYVPHDLPTGISPDEDAMVRTALGEAAGEGPLGQRGVIHVIKNRASASGMSPLAVTQASGQFEPWGNAATRAKLEAIDPRSPEYQQMLQLVRDPGADPTNGATHFYAPKLQAQLGRAAPDWAQGTPTVIGGHQFYRVGYSAPTATASGGAPGAAAPGTAAPGTVQVAGPGAPTGPAATGTAPAPLAMSVTPGATVPPGTTEPGTTAPGATAPGATAPATTAPGTTAPTAPAPDAAKPQVEEIPAPGQLSRSQQQTVDAMRYDRNVTGKDIRDTLERFEDNNRSMRNTAMVQAHQAAVDKATAEKTAFEKQMKLEENQRAIDSAKRQQGEYDQKMVENNRTYPGNSPEAADNNLLIKGQTDAEVQKSVGYANAFARVAVQKTESGLTYNRDMSMFKTPLWAPQDGDSKGGRDYGKPVQTNVPTAADMTKWRDGSVAAASLFSSFHALADAWEKASPTERAETLAGRATPLGSAWTNAAMMAKGDALFKLGVLSGPDLQVIQGAIANPRTFMGAWTSADNAKAQIAQLEKLVQTNLDALAKFSGGAAATQAGAGSSAAPRTDRPPLTSYGKK